jgi:hypothetical protein
MTQVGFEHTIHVLERVKTVHASERAASVIGNRKLASNNNRLGRITESLSGQVTSSSGKEWGERGTPEAEMSCCKRDSRGVDEWHGEFDCACGVRAGGE